MTNAFIPLYQGTKQIAATAASANVALAKGTERNIEISNEGPDTVFVEFGGSSIAAAAATGYPVLPGQSKVIRNIGQATYAAAICAAGKTATVYFTCGDGE